MFAAAGVLLWAVEAALPGYLGGILFRSPPAAAAFADLLSGTDH
jgi:hypothetical protein